MKLRATLAAVVLTGALLIVPTPAVAAPPGDVACNTYSILGLRGSGESRPSGTSFQGSYSLVAFAAAVKSVLGSSKVATINVWYEAKAVPGTDPNKTKETKPVDYVRYAQSASNGVANLRSMIASRNRACPSERVIVAGYSQGAWAAHAALNSLADSNGIVKGVYAAALIADPLFKNGQGVNLGTAKSAGAAGNSISSTVGKLLKNSASGVPYFSHLFTPGFKSSKVYVRQLCDKNDAVCDSMQWMASKISFDAGLAVHLAYNKNTATMSSRVNPLGYAIAKAVKK